MGLVAIRGNKRPLRHELGLQLDQDLEELAIAHR